MADLKTFGKELIRGNFGNALKSLSPSPGVQTMDVEPYAYRNGMFFFGSGSGRTFFQYSDINSALNAYVSCPELQSIINRRALAHCNGKRWIMRQGGKGKGKEDTSEYASKCRALLNRPNPFQSGIQFENQLKIYVDVFGWCVILPIYAGNLFAARGLSEASALFLIPPFMLSYEETGYWRSQKKISDLLRSLTLSVGGERTPLDLNQVVIIKDLQPRMNGGSIESTGGMAEMLLFPDTKVRANEKPISNIIGAYDSRGELINYAGAQGIISPDVGSFNQYTPMALSADEQKDLQEKFRMQYGIRSRQYRHIISPQALKFSPIGRPTKDLMLFEEIEADVRALCNAWPYPWKLLADSGSSLNGTEVDSLQRNLYQDAIIPEASSIEQQLAEAFKASENGTYWEKDYSHVPCMQADAKQAAENRKLMGEAVINEFKNGLITYNRALELMGEDPVNSGDVYYSEWVKNNQNTNDGTTNTTGNQQA